MGLFGWKNFPKSSKKEALIRDNPGQVKVKCLNTGRLKLKVKNKITPFSHKLQGASSLLFPTWGSAILISLKQADSLSLWFHNLKMSDIPLYWHQPWLIVSFYIKPSATFIWFSLSVPPSQMVRTENQIISVSSHWTHSGPVSCTPEMEGWH